MSDSIAAGDVATCEPGAGDRSHSGAILRRSGQSWVSCTSTERLHRRIIAWSSMRLRQNTEVGNEIERYRESFKRPIDHELIVTLRAGDLPFPLRPLLNFESVYRNPVEWSGTMPEMDWIVSGRTCSMAATGSRDGTREHGHRLAVPCRGRREASPGERSRCAPCYAASHSHPRAALSGAVCERRCRTKIFCGRIRYCFPRGSCAEILLELSNPGKWMLHCHIAEHIESGMRMVFEVANHE